MEGISWDLRKPGATAACAQVGGTPPGVQIATSDGLWSRMNDFALTSWHIHGLAPSTAQVLFVRSRARQCEASTFRTAPGAVTYGLAG